MIEQPALFDTHAHLHDPWIGDDLPDVMARASEAGVERIVTIGCSLEDSRNALAVAEQYDNVWATVGVHPHDAKDWNADIEAEFTRMAESDQVVAIGEIGLDFYRNLSPHKDQYKAFEAQLALANDLNLPVVIHSRDAHEETYQILKDWAQSHAPPAPQSETSRPHSSSPPAVRRGEMSRSDRGGHSHVRQHPLGVIHCFSGDADLAHRYHDLGFLISFAGPVTYPKNHALREAAASLPLEAIVIETDCPYLGPQPQRGKRNESANIHHTANQIAEVRGESVGVVARQSTANAHGLYRSSWASEAGVP
ncbi:MAG: TatD family hydrolase [Chloroflexi bacterium]|nr:TatD family hydrolase [Chloroflexota bacterium]